MSKAAGVFLASVFIFTVSAHADKAERSPRFLVHLLDYLAKDYGGAVADGNVLSQSEYNELMEFSQSTLETNKALHETRSHPEIKTKLENLNHLILTKANAEQVSKLAREIQVRVIEVTHLEVAPARWPNLATGKLLFSQNCVSCHGSLGGGDGPAGAALDPKPANFLDDHMKEISPFQAYNTIRMGVPGTGMPPFHTFSDKEIWDLAFFLVSLRHKSGETQSVTFSTFSNETLQQVATFSDEKLGKVFDKKSDRERAFLIAALRTHSEDDSSGGGTLAVAETQLEEAFTDYKTGNVDSAKTKALKAYLEGIEPVEPRLKATDPQAVGILETKMAAVRGAIENKAPISEVQSKVFLAKEQITIARKLMSSEPMAPWVAFMAAAAILFREGFEAVLIVIALLGVIRAARSRRAALWVHGGWTSALGLGAVAWFFSGWLMGLSGAHRETLEGATSLFAVAILLVVGFWLHSQTEIGRWKAFIHGKVQKALDGKNLWALASISFIAVFREAFETVLFLRAIWLEGGDGAKIAMASGVFSSLAVVILLAWAILKYSAKLPIRRLFEASAVVMAALAVILTGKGIHSFQETGAISVTNPSFPVRADLLGLYPTWETVASQIVILVLVLFLWNLGKKSTTAPPVSVEVAEG